jgi:hypothetical protein
LENRRISEADIKVRIHEKLPELRGHCVGPALRWRSQTSSEAVKKLTKDQAFRVCKVEE